MWVVLDVPHSGGERAGSTWKRWGSGPIPSSSAIPPYHCSLAPGKREGRKHQRLKGFAVCPRAIFEVNCWQSLACSPDRCVFMPPWALSPASQSFCSWNTQVRMPSVHRGLYPVLCRELPVSRELHQSRETQISLSQNLCQEVLSWFVFFHTDTAISPSRLPTLRATSLISR